MRRMVLFLGLIAAVLGAQARMVTPSEARKAAATWARSGLVVGGNVRSASAIATDDGSSIYAAALSGGTVFLSGETVYSPVILFVAGTNDFSTVDAIDRASPLWAILNRHQARIARARASSGAGVMQHEVAAAEKEWEALLSGEDAALPSAVEPVEPARLSTLSDVRSGPLVQSQWDQSTAGGKRCYNRYTPKLSDGSYAVCGCVATAMSQVMRYHGYPTQKVNPVTRECYVQASTLKQSEATKILTTQGGTYDWSKMPLRPAAGVTDAECEAIGKLTSDAGISVCMGYDTTSGGGSGAFMFNVAPALMKVFGYASAHFYTVSSGSVSDSMTVVRKAMLSNFDAGYPVLMGIAGTLGGHAIVGDGYGYKDGTLYVHVNMGWSGSSDAWYALPKISSFTVFDDLVYDIFPTAAGGRSATLSGRVVDDEGKAVSGATVEIRSGEVVVTNVVTSSKGIYGVRVEPGAYDIVATSLDGTLKETQSGVGVQATGTTTGSMSGYITTTWIKTFSNIPSVTSVGNLQKQEEIVLYKPTVRIGEKHQYASLEKALADAKNFWTGVADEPVAVEIFADTELAATRTIDFPCVVFSTDVRSRKVTRSGAAGLSVSESGTLTLSNVTFSANAETLVEVAKGGCLTVGALVTLGVPETVVAVRTQRADGFHLTARPAAWFSMECATAKNVNDVFGYASGDLAGVTLWAGKFVNLDDPNGELAGAPIDGGSSPYALKWTLQPVPLEDATAYYVLDDARATTNCFRRLDRLFELFENVAEPAEVTLVKDGTLSRRVTPKADLVFRSANGSVVSNLAATAGFVVTNGITLAIAGVSFDRYTGEGLFVVDGGELVLSGEMAVRNITGTLAAQSGAVTIQNGGQVTVGSAEGTVLFDGCCNDAVSSHGGAFYLKKGSLSMGHRVTVTNCSARSSGGAIYFDKNGSVALSGLIRIAGNQGGSYADDIYYKPVSPTDMSTDNLHLVGALETGSRVGVRTVSRPKAGTVFAVIAEGFTDKAAILKTAAAFFSNNLDSYIAEPTVDNTALSWAVPSTEIKTVDPSLADCCVVASDDTRAYYATIYDAFLAIGTREKVEVLRNLELTKDLCVTCLTQKVTLKSADGGPYTITRAAPCQIKIGAGVTLTVEDLVLSGQIDDDRGGNGTLFEVKAGDLTLGSGAVVENVKGSETRSGAIGVSAKGVLTLLDGAEIRNCVNSYTAESLVTVGCGGAITSDGSSTIRLLGGLISGCCARNGGAAFIANASTVEFGGAFTAIANGTLESAVNNIAVAYACPLRLVSVLTGRVGYTAGLKADDDVFGSVAVDFDGTDGELADSAHRFTHDQTGDLGFAVRSGDETLLVWSDALAVDGTYTDATGRVYSAVSGGVAVPADLPTAAEGLVYTATEQVGVAEGRGYVVAEGRATSAGHYQATVTLKSGFVWSDGDPSAERKIDWTITAAPLSVSARAASKKKGEEDPLFIYDVDGLQGADVAADVLTGKLAREAGEEPGVYAITQGTLSVIGANYTLSFTGATFTITGEEPGPTPEPVPCVPFAFTSIVQKDDGSWLLTINPAVKYCTYSLQTSDDLDTWTPVGSAEMASEDGDFKFNPPTEGVKRFWKVIGKDGVKPTDE